VGKGLKSGWMVPAYLVLYTVLSSGQDQTLDRQFQSAVSAYKSGHLPEAASQLEALLPHVPKSFEVHELLGLVYAAQSQNTKAVEQLEAAADLKPDSAAARTNLAAALYQAGKAGPAEEQFRKALVLDPQNYDASHNLGELYVQSKRIADAVPLLEKAQQIRPSYNNGYDLALAYFMTGKLDAARSIVESLLKARDTGELHNLLAQIDEKQDKFVEAANEYEAAAHMDPSESNLFDWGSEMLLHRTYDPAITVFQQGVQRYPDSPRLQIGLGMGLYARGRYDEAISALLKAADLNPADPRCYFFLSKAYESSPNRADDVIERFRRFAEIQPNNAMAQYYYAASLWKGKQVEGASANAEQVASLLKKSIALDAKMAEAHALLGNVFAERREYDKAIPEYARALELNPNLPDTHYRLGVAYVHTGQKDRAQGEFDVYQKLRAQHLAEMDKERAAVQQFVYSEQGTSAARP